MKKKRFFLFTAALLAALTATAAALQLDQRSLAGKLIRLHVVANSDSEEDQAIKLQVRDAVLQVTEGLEKEELSQSLPEIQAAAEQRLRELNCRDQVTVSLREERFPTRVYDSFALPAGVYTALRVTIGAGEGHNWWCVAFPSICFRATAADLEEAAAAAGFTTQDVALITEANESYVLKFKTLELLEQLKLWLFQ